jgi:predicted transcriptional regulator
MRDLASEAGVSLGAVARLEGGEVVSHEATSVRIVAAFERRGVDVIVEPDKAGAVLVFARGGDAALG